MSWLEKEYTEKRGYIRMDLDAEMTFNIKGGNQINKGKTTNLSHIGVQFETSEPVKEGTLLDAVIKTTSSIVRPLQVSCTVKRVEQVSSGKYLVACEVTHVK